MITIASCRAVVRPARHLAIVAAAVFAMSPAAGEAHAAPEIRTSPRNSVPACVTPERLMAFLRSRNARPDPRFGDIAHRYKRYGEAWRVRWDYAFFQMALETNFLTYLRGDGRRGDVDPRQNNFAGLGTTGGGVPGDSFPDVKTGVHAHIQHLVAYSGERIAAPLAQRTSLKQDDIVSASARLNRAVTFADLTRRWAVDRNYWRSIEAVAQRYRDAYCRGPEASAGLRSPAPLGGPGNGALRHEAPPQLARPPSPARTIWSRGTSAPPSVGWAPPRVTNDQVAALQPLNPACKVLTASYGGTRTLLIRAEAEGEIRYTALGVLDGFEQSMAASYIASRAPGGTSIGTFETRDAAIARAREFCPGG